jgi:hypothetical protein
MKHVTQKRALKPLLLGSVALAIVGLSPAMSQDRTQMPGAASQSKDSDQPSARENRNQSSPRAQDSERATTGQSSPSPSASQSGETNPRNAQDRDGDAKSPKANRTQDRDAQPPKGNQAQDRDKKRDQNQARERDGKRDRDQAQDRDSKRDRDEAQDRDAKRDRDQAQDRDTKRDRNQAQDRDTRRDRDQARERDSDRTRDRDQARDTDRQQDRNASRAGERQVTEQQRTRISASIRQANVQPVRNVNFSVSVGAVVPASVRFYPVTPAIVEVYPEYRGYRFVLIEDEIVIVEPRSRKIVTVIDSGGSGRAAVHTRGKLTLTEKQRDVVRRAAVQRRTTGSARTTTIERDYVIGEDIPEAVEIETFPETVYTEVPEIRSYRYVVREDDVYVIDPSERRVIEIIR